jgi:hypothetical protein
MESFQQLRVYQFAEKISNELWFIVQKWDDFAKDTMGKQIVRSADIAFLSNMRCSPGHRA